jgi:hypothetical protein
MLLGRNFLGTITSSKLKQIKSHFMIKFMFMKHSMLSNDSILRPKLNFAFSSVLKTKIPSVQHSLEERKAAYFAARDRIFSMDLGEFNEPVKQKPRSNPVVARRMIAHALGHRINPQSQTATLGDCKGHSGQTDAPHIQCRNKVEPKSPLEASQKTISLPGQNMSKLKNNDKNSSGSSPSKSNVPQKQADKISPHVSISQNESSGNGVDKDYKREHLGAAKRMFAHALGLQSGKDGFILKCSDIKQINTE